MNDYQLTMSDLFGQLGLPTDEQHVDNFIEQHAGLPTHIMLDQAPFWNEAQSTFLKNALTEDAEWAEVIDQLNSRLR